MNRLIVNTANSNLLVQLVCDEKIFVKNELSVKKHNERILILIEEILKENDITLNDIDEFGVVIGPGSFTGIRVGIATIKAFKDATKRKAVGVNNLEILFNLAKEQNINIVAIEGSLNSYFVAENVNGKLYIYNRNLTEEELKELTKDNSVGCYEISERMKDSTINFKQLDLDYGIINEVFKNATDVSLVPVYYQLSQAENDKINRANVEIVDLAERDIENVESLELQLFNDDSIGDKAWSKDIIKGIIFNDNYIKYVAKIGNEIVGYIVCEVTDEINISRVAVAGSYQNHGIATKLINFVFDKAKEKDMNLSLEVCENNIRAYKLYTKLGFELRRVRKNYYKDGSSAIEMIKNKQ